MIFGWLKRVLQRLRRPVSRSSHELVLYTRVDCHLCETALIRIRRVLASRQFTLQVIDIDTDPALVSRYDQCVPVLIVNGKVRFRGDVNEVLLTRLLDAEERPKSRA